MQSLTTTGRPQSSDVILPPEINQGAGNIRSASTGPKQQPSFKRPTTQHQQIVRHQAKLRKHMNQTSVQGLRPTQFDEAIDGLDESFNDHSAIRQMKSSAGFSRKRGSIKSMMTPPLELERALGKGSGMNQTKPNFLFEIHVDREGQSTAIKKALRVKKMSKKLKAFTATAAGLKTEAVNKKEKEMSFLSKTYVTSNPLELSDLQIPLKQKPLIRRHKSKKHQVSQHIQRQRELAQSTLDITRVHSSMENNDINYLQTLTLRKSDGPNRGFESDKRTPSNISNPSASIVKVEQTSDDQINLNMKPFNSATDAKLSTGHPSDGNDEELLLVGNKYQLESPRLTTQNRLDQKQPLSEMKILQNLSNSHAKVRSRKTKSKSPSFKFRNSPSMQRGTNSSVQVSPDRISLQDRFDLHSKTVAAEKSGSLVLGKVEEENLEIEKMVKELRDKEKALARLKLDEKLMKQDLATYETRVCEKYGFVGRCQDMVSSIDQGLLRFSSTNPEGDVELKKFLDEIEGEFTQVVKIKEVRGARTRDLMKDTEQTGEQQKPRLTDEEYTQANNCKARRELFKTYFIDQ